VLLGRTSDNLVAIDLDRDELAEPFLGLNPKLRKTLQSRGARGRQLWMVIKGDYPQIGIHGFEKDGEKAGGWRCSGFNEQGEWKGAQSVIFGRHPDTGKDYQLLVEEPAIEVSYDEVNWPEWLKPPHVQEQEREERKRKAEAAAARASQKGSSASKNQSNLDSRIQAYVDTVDIAVSGEHG